MSASQGDRRWRRALWVGAAVIAGFALFVLYLAAGPLQSDDMWFHLRMGRHFLEEGLWSGWDPILHTAYERDPVQHEWLFDVAIHVLDRIAGFLALRAANLVGAVLALGLAFSILRREARGAGVLLLGTSLFLALSWWRVYELRPHLFSIVAALCFFRLLLEPEEPPSWRRVAAATLLLVLWANLHSGFVLGPALLLAGCLGVALRALAQRGLLRDGPAAAAEWRRLRRLFAAWVVGLLATLLNPRGIHQHLTYAAFRSGSVATPARDDWTGFQPLRYQDFGGPVSRLEWLLTDAVLVAFVVGSVVALARLLRRPSASRLAAADPVRLGLGVASWVAIGLAIRFSWLVIFPLLFLLRVDRTLLASSTAPVRRRADTGSAALAVGVALAFFGAARYRSFAVVEPAFFDRPYVDSKYHPVGVQLLGETGVEGNLYNPYHLGGFLGYWLAPGLRSFIDGRNEQYPPDVFRDWALVARRQGARPGEGYLDVLDRRRVDLFFGTGYPLGTDPRGVRVYTTSHLDGVEGWLPIFRAVDHALYLRRDERNRTNLERVAAFYEREGVPFERSKGFDVAAVLAARPDWAVAHRMVPAGYPALLDARLAAEERIRFAAVDRLATLHALLGAWETEIALEREALAIQPAAPGPRRRLVHALLRLGRLDEAAREARPLEELARRDPRTAAFARAPGEVRRRLARAGRRGETGAPETFLDGLPLLDPVEARLLLRGRFAPVERIDRSRFAQAEARHRSP